MGGHGRGGIVPLAGDDRRAALVVGHNGRRQAGAYWRARHRPLAVIGLRPGRGRRKEQATVLATLFVQVIEGQVAKVISPLGDSIQCGEVGGLQVENGVRASFLGGNHRAGGHHKGVVLTEAEAAVVVVAAAQAADLTV